MVHEAVNYRISVIFTRGLNIKHTFNLRVKFEYLVNKKFELYQKTAPSLWVKFKGG